MTTEYNRGAHASRARISKVLSSLLVLAAVFCVEPARAAPFIYVTSIFSRNMLSVFDLANGALVRDIQLAGFPTGLAVSPDGKRVYVGVFKNTAPHIVTVLDATTNQAVEPPITLSSEPGHVAVSPDGRRVYVTHAGANFLSAIDTRSNAVTRIDLGNKSKGVAVTPDGRFVVVTHESGSPSVSMINAATNAVIGFNVGAGAVNVAVPPDGKLVYVLSGNGLFSIDTGTFEVSRPIPVGSGFTEMAITPNGKQIFMINGGQSRNLAVVDTITRQVIATPTPGDNTRGVAVGADGKFAYVTCSGTVAIVDTNTNTVVDRIQVGTRPGDGENVALAPPPLGPFAYVTNSEDHASVSVIDTRTQKLVGTVKLPDGSAPEGIAVSPDGSRAYVANNGSGNVAIIDTTTNLVANLITVGSRPFAVAVSPDGKSVYVTSGRFPDPGAVSIISTASNTVVKTVTVETEPTGIVVTPDSKRAYVTSHGSNSVSAIDRATGEVIAGPITVGNSPEGIAITPDGKFVFVANADLGGTQIVSVIDTASNKVRGSIPVGAVPTGIAVSPDGKTAYVTNFGASPGQVSIIDTTTYHGIVDVRVEVAPKGVAINPDGTFAYVVNSNNVPGTVSVIDTETRQPITKVTVGGSPKWIAIKPRAN